MRVVAHNGARILGGAERATVLLLSGLQSRGHDVLLMCNDEAVANYSSSVGVPSTISVIGGDLSLLDARRFATSLAAEKPEAVIVGTWKKLFFASWAAKKAGVTRIVARVGLESDTPRSIKYRYALRHWTDAVVVNADIMAKSFTELDGFNPRNVRVIHNGVIAPERRLSPGELRRELGIPSDAAVVGTVARLVSQKRIDRFLRAFALLGHDAHCVIAGDGKEMETLMQLASTLDILERVHFLGHRENKGDVLDAMDVFVVSSDSEGMSNAMLEAMAFGLPVVSTPVSGAHDALLADAGVGAPGLVVNFEEKAIAGGIAKLFDRADTRRSMGRAARTIAATRFSLDSMLDRWEEVLASQHD